MDLFSSTKPLLVNPGTGDRITQKVIQSGGPRKELRDGLQDLQQKGGQLYDQYLRPNRQLIVVLILIALFLYYRTTLDRDPLDPDENFDPLTCQHQGDHLIYQDHATMNPMKRVSQQPNYARYPPDPLPLNIQTQAPTAQGLIYTRGPQQNYSAPAIETAPIVAPPAGACCQQNQFQGFHNPYEHTTPQPAHHPFGWDGNFNQPTANFGNFMIDQNRQTLEQLQEYENVLRGTDVLYGPPTGPEHLDDGWEETIDPPYLE